MAKQAEKRQLKFNMTVDQMLLKADSFMSNYATDMAALAAVDPEFTAAWGTDFQAAIDAGYSTPSPETLIDQLKVLTDTRNDKLLEAATSVQELLFYVDKAVPQNAEIYGRGSKYEEASRNSTKMVRLMEAAQTQITIDQAALEAKGYTLAKITAFGDKITALHTASKAQQDKENDNLRATEAYYDTQNAVWDRMVALNRAAMIAFLNDSEKRDQYLLYGSGGGDLVFTMTIGVAPDVQFHHILEPLAPDQIIRVKRLTGLGAVWLCFANANGEACAGAEQPLNVDEKDFVYSMFASGGQYLRARTDFSSPMSIRVTIPVM